MTNERKAEAIGNNIEALLCKSERTYYLVELLEIKDDLLQQAQSYYDLTGTHYSIAGSQETLFRLANLSPLETNIFYDEPHEVCGFGD